MERKGNQYLLLLIIFISSFAFQTELAAQSDQQKLDEYLRLATQYKNENKPSLELDYLNKAAFLCWDNQQYDNAVEYFERGIVLNEQMGNKNGTKLIYYYVGMIHSEIEQYQKAIDAFNKGLALSRDLNRKGSIVSGLINIAQAYQGMGDHQKTNELSLEALEIAKELNDLKLIRTCYGMISESYKELGNSEKSIEFFNLFAAVDKHIKAQEISQIKQQSANEVTRANQETAETQQELLKQTDKLRETEDSLAVVERISKERQMQLELKELQIREQEAQLKFERLLRNIFVFGFILILIFALTLYALNRKIKAQKTQIEDQRDKLGLQNKQISSSIYYAQNIQRAILPLTQTFDEQFESFILYRPKDIVSGDFYWFVQSKEKIFIAVVDCTGHGVPGAFMSMIGTMLLNEIVVERGIDNPSLILTELDEHIKFALKQEKTENADGMDVCLISLENKTNNECSVIFAGAKRPLYYFSKKENKMNEIKSDRNSIGGTRNSSKKKTFTNHSLSLYRDDIVYLTSDGIIDQNSPDRKRFGSNKLLSILSDNIDEKMEIQRTILERELDNFQGDAEQRDDISLIGLKIK